MERNSKRKEGPAAEESDSSEEDRPQKTGTNKVFRTGGRVDKFKPKVRKSGAPPSWALQANSLQREARQAEEKERKAREQALQASLAGEGGAAPSEEQAAPQAGEPPNSPAPQARGSPKGTNNSDDIIAISD